MEAVLFDGKSLTLKHCWDYPMPRIEKNDEVIVKVEYSGISSIDLNIIKGEFPVSKARPLPLGQEFSGTVHMAGLATGFTKGQKVVVDPNHSCYVCSFCRKGNYQYCLTAGNNTTVGIWKDGGWAKYVIVPQEQVYVLPDEITTEQACLCYPYSCVSHGFDRVSPLHVGDKILIIGAGIIGTLWATTLHHHGHRDITISELNTKRQECAKRLDNGEYKLVTPEDLQKGAGQYDVIVNCTGVGQVMDSYLKYLRQGGKFVIFGCSPRHNQASVNPFEIYEKELTIIGVKINPYSVPTAIGWIKAMGDRYLDYEKLGVKTYTLAQYEQALTDLKTCTVAKAIFKV